METSGEASKFDLAPIFWIFRTFGAGQMKGPNGYGRRLIRPAPICGQNAALHCGF